MIGTQIIYLSTDGRFLLEGDIVDITTQENLTENRRVQARKIAIDAFGEDKMIAFVGADPEHTITVFTDTECTYCRKLHAEIAAINELGIGVRYLLLSDGLVCDNEVRAHNQGEDGENIGNETPLSFRLRRDEKRQGQHSGEVHGAMLIRDELAEASGVKMKEAEPDR